MKKFNLFKTVQLVIFIALAVFSLVIVFKDPQLYQIIGHNVHVKLLCFILWLVLGISFVFMFIDFSSYTRLRQENNELDFAVFYDPLTGIANRYRCDAYIEQYKHKALPKDMGCVTFIMTSLKPINDQFGHEAGDAAIRDFSDILAKESENTCFIGRNGGNKFLAIFSDCRRRDIDVFLKKVREACDNRNQASATGDIGYASGFALNEGKEITELIALSDRRALDNLEQ